MSAFQKANEFNLGTAIVTSLAGASLILSAVNVKATSLDVEKQVIPESSNHRVLVSSTENISAAIDYYNQGAAYSQQKQYSQAIASSLNPKLAEKKLLGSWQATREQEQVTLIFAPNNKLFILSSKNFYSVAYEFNYHINTQAQPMQIDLIFGSLKILTIFELTDDNQLRIEFPKFMSQNSRLKAFSPEAVGFQKISDSTTLPPNTRVEPFEIVMRNQAIKARQSEAKHYVSSINKNQISYGEYNSIFADSFDSLELYILAGKREAETANYSYKLVVSDRNKTMVTALPKLDGLKSYVGIVYRYENSADKVVMSSVICESNEPTKIPPAPKLDSIPRGRPTCPPGYVDLDRPIYLSPFTIKAVQSEAQNYMSAFNKIQASYWVENSVFAASFDSLGLYDLSGAREAETTYYSYKIVVADRHKTMVTAIPKFDGLKSYLGIIHRSKNSTDKAVFYSEVCESNEPTKNPSIPRLETISQATPICPSGFLKWSR